MNIKGFTATLKDIRLAIQDVQTTEDGETKRYRCRKVMSHMQLLMRSRTNSPTVRVQIDSFAREFLKRLEGENDQDVGALRFEALRRKYEGRIESFAMAGNNNLSPHIMREVKSLSDAALAACTIELNDAMPTTLGKPRLRLVT